MTFHETPVGKNGLITSTGGALNMPQISLLEKHIYNIGRRMVKCGNNCSGIVNRSRDGIVPRCLIFDAKHHGSRKGCVIVGLNPGHAKSEERKAYISDVTYEKIVEYWKMKISGRRYYKQLKQLIDAIGLEGHVLWTELVKCEGKKGTSIPLQTFRTCMKEYLNEELKSVPWDWPFIGVGKEAYRALAYSFPERIVLGLPHPTGSYGQFAKLIKNRRMIKLLEESLNNLWDGRTGKACWVDTKKGRCV